MITLSVSARVETKALAVSFTPEFLSSGMSRVGAHGSRYHLDRAPEHSQKNPKSIWREVQSGRRPPRPTLATGRRLKSGRSVPDVFSLEVSKYCRVFKSRSDIFGVFGPLRSLQNFSLSEWRL